MIKEKQGFPLLLQWAGKDAVYIYIAIGLSLVASIFSIVPYYVVYRIFDAIVTKLVLLIWH